MSREFHILIRIEVIQKTYECLVSAECNFALILAMLYRMKKHDFEDVLESLEDSVVWTADGMYCDRDVSLVSLGVRDEMIFVVY